MATLYGAVAIGAFDSSFGFGFYSDKGAICTATMSANATVFQFGVAVVSGPATMTAESSVIRRGAASISASATLTSTATGVFSFSSAMSGSSTLSATLSTTISVQANLGSGGAVLYTPTATETSVQTASSSVSWGDVATISASEFTGGEDYLILCSANVGNLSSTSTLNHFKMIHGSTDFVGSSKVVESHDASEPSDVYGYMTKFTQPATPEDIKFQFKGSNTQADSISIIAMPLASLTENTDYFFNEDDDSASPTSHGTSYSSFASVSFTPTNNNDDWLVIANPTVRVDSTADNYLYSIKHGTDDRPYFSHEGEDVGENSTTILSRVFTLSNASSQTFAVQGKDDSTGINDHYASRIFVLRLNAMRDYAFSWSAGRQIHTQNTFKKVSSVSVTPTTSSKALLIGYVRHESASENNNIKAKIEDNSYAKPTGADGLVAVARDSTDERAAVRLAPTNFIGYKTHDIDLSVAVDWDTDSAVNTYDHSLCAVSFALADVPAGAVLTADATPYAMGAVALSGSATLTSAATVTTINGSAALSSSATLSPSPIMTVVGASAMSVTSEVTTGATLLNTIALSGTVAVTSVGRIKVSGKVSFTTSATISSIARAEYANLESTANIAGKGVLSLRAIAPMSASLAMSSIGIIAISVTDNDIIDVTGYIDQSKSVALHIDEGISPSLYVDQELATSLER